MVRVVTDNYDSTLQYLLDPFGACTVLRREHSSLDISSLVAAGLRVVDCC